MAERKNPRPSGTRSGAAPRQRQQQSRQQRTRRQPVKKQSFSLSALFRRKEVDFKPDSNGPGILKKFHLTHVQRDTILKWGLYSLVIILLLTIQDVIMSRIHFFGGTTDLAACVILLITVIEGIDTGSLFVLLASCFYYFSGSSPGPLTVALLSILGIGACFFRQMYLHRSRGSVTICAGLALILYELATYVAGVAQGLTRWDRIGSFAATGIISFLLMIPLYKLINKIGLIGGNTWKE